MEGSDDVYRCQIIWMVKMEKLKELKEFRFPYFPVVTTEFTYMDEYGSYPENMMEVFQDTITKMDQMEKNSTAAVFPPVTTEKNPLSTERIGVFEIRITDSASISLVESKFQYGESVEDFKFRFWDDIIRGDASVESCDLIEIYEVPNDR